MTDYSKDKKANKKRNERGLAFLLLSIVVIFSISFWILSEPWIKRQPVSRRSTQPVVSRSSPANNPAAWGDHFNRGFNREIGSSKNIRRRNDASLRRKLSQRQTKRTADKYGISEEKFKKKMMDRALREMGY
ncbi:MAG: hypothetical protein HQ594_00875 [Candidatus Omnitrophica bacterium]|nr:hypothetical protein [Candidatus Omnitrophota bacterium]